MGLRGSICPSYKVTKTDELIKQGHLSQLDIQCLVLKHPPQKFEVYNDEIEYLITHEQRNKFIKNLALDLKGNSLILYSRVEAHGAVLYDLINKNKKDNQKVFFVHGGVDAESREQIREITENEKNAIIVAPTELSLLVSIFAIFIISFSLLLQVAYTKSPIHRKSAQKRSEQS